MSKKLQCQDCGRAEYGEDLYNYDGEILCRYCIVARVYEGSTSCEYVGICNDETFPNKTEQIAQLKQQLAEKDKDIEKLKQQLEESFTEDDVEGLIEDRQKTIKFLQEQLAKKDKEIEKLEQQLEETKDEIDLYNKFVSGGTIDEVIDAVWRKREIDKLKKQLVKKQNVINEINKEFVQAIHDWRALCDEKDKEIEALKTKQELTFMHSKEDYFQRCNLLEEENIKLQFAQTQLAIQELERIKELLLIESKKYPIIYDKSDDLVGGAIDKEKVFEIINQQIKELKGE